MINKDNGFDLGIRWRFPGGREYAFAFIALFAFLIVIYANSFQGAFQFDDASNIVENKNIFLKTLDWSDITKTFYGIEGNKITRPLSYFSFALNYYFHNFDVFGYHVVNFAIHYLASIFLFLFIYRTLNLPTLRERYGQTSYSIALLATFFWATSPLQVTAVTYIVQRMASMTGLFYIMAMYFYLKGRTANRYSICLIYFALCTVSAALSLGTKENAVLLPVSILLYDLLMIQGITRENLIKNLKVFSPVIMIVTLLGLWYVDISSILSGAAYANRPFTLTERLLTEPRIVIFYITLLLYPLGSRLTLLHDIEFSTSLIAPWTTIPAIALILGFIALALYLASRSPFISFAILFYFLNHAMESTFIPLELIYEHRNYIPSMFFFVPLAIIILKIIDYFSYKKSIQWTIIAVFIFIIAAQGHTVFLRNALFAHPLLLWENNVKKAPKLSNTHHNLGSSYWNMGLYDDAYQSYVKALYFNRHMRLSNKGVVLYSIGMCHLYGKGEYDNAIWFLQSAIKANHEYWPAYKDLAICYIQKGNLKEAEKMIESALVLWPQNLELNDTLAFVLLKAGKYEKAISAARHALELNPNDHNSLCVLGEASRKRGHYQLASFYWQSYMEKTPNSIEGILALIEIYSGQNDKENLTKMIEKLMSAQGSKNWHQFIDQLQRNPKLTIVTQPNDTLIEIITNNISNQLKCSTGKVD